MDAFSFILGFTLVGGGLTLLILILDAMSGCPGHVDPRMPDAGCKDRDPEPHLD